jgi:thiol-disulfide isomerase/thioredoxin
VAWADLPKPIVVNIWASWCGPCRSEMPLLDGYARQGYPIFFLNASESANTVQVYLQRENFGLTTHLDGAGLNNQLGVRGLPTTVVIGADGKVLARHLGPLDRVQLERLLALTR